MTRIIKCLTALAVAIALAGCSDNNRTTREALPVDFTAFVKTEVQKQAVDLEPVNINELEFSFNDQNNEQAFDELF